jgi:hypothetical protein
MRRHRALVAIATILLLVRRKPGDSSRFIASGISGAYETPS